MDEIAIVVDSTAYIPEKLIKEHNIHVIPVYLHMEGEDYRDGVDISPDEFYRRLQSTSDVPTTSQPSIGEFENFFREMGKKADSILAIFISDELSGSLDSAHSAVDLIQDIPITIVDSRSTSMGLGFIVLAAARAIKSGKNLEETTKLTRDLIPKTKLMFVVDDLKYLHRGGRIGGAKRLMGSLLSMKPILHLLNGRIEPFESVRTKKKALSRMLDVIEEDLKDKKSVRMATFNALAADEASYLEEQLRIRFNPDELLFTEMSPAIGNHVGPGTFGVAYYTED